MSQFHLPHDHGQQTQKVIEKIPDITDFKALAELFRQLSDGSRLRIFWLLCHCEECVTNLSAMMDMSSPAVSHHLRQLKSAGLLVSRREGKEVYYTAADTERAHVLHDALETLMSVTCPNLPIDKVGNWGYANHGK